MDDRDEPGRALLQSAMQEFLEGARAVVALVGSAGSGALSAVPQPVAAPVTRMLISLQQLIEHAPPLTEELDVVLEEVHAKRLTVQALQAELAAFDSQLDILQKSLAPLEVWAHQWTQLRQSLTETLSSATPHGRSSSDTSPPHSSVKSP